MQPSDMTQQRATERAWRAASEAEGKAHLGDAAGAHALAAVSEAWARVASQLPLASVELAAEPTWSRTPAGEFVRSDEQRVAVPAPRPLRVTDEQLGPDEPDLGARIAAESRDRNPFTLETWPESEQRVAEQAAAADALRGVDPLDPRTPIDDVEATAILAVKAHEPIDDAHDPGVCAGCTQPIAWRGGVWIDVTGGALCRTQSR